MTTRRDTDMSGTHCPQANRVLAALVVAALLTSAGAAHAAFTTETCLAGKAKAWGKLRNCQRIEEAKQLQGKPSDPAKCQTKFTAKHVTISDKATEAAVKCRHGVTRAGTVTDYDTGLMWEVKDPLDQILPGDQCSPIDLFEDHCVTNAYAWGDAHVFVSGVSADGDTLVTFRGFSDWRLPTIVELQTIVDTSVAGCGSVGPPSCIDPIFGPTSAALYWSGTTHASFANSAAWVVNFDTGGATFNGKSGSGHVRAVRAGL